MKLRNIVLTNLAGGALTLGLSYSFLERYLGELKREYEFMYDGKPAYYESFELRFTKCKSNPRQIRLSNGDIIVKGTLTSDDGRKIKIEN